MEVPESAVLKIQKFVQNRQAAEKESAHEPLSATALHAYARRLDGTLLQLQDQVRQQEEDLRKVCETPMAIFYNAQLEAHMASTIAS